MTTTKRGYKLHDKFQVINDKYSCGYYNVGMIVELVHDDGTDRPLFSVISGSTCKQRRPDGSICYIPSDDVQLLDKKEQKEQTVIAKQSSIDNYEFRIRTLEKENAFLTSMLMNAGLL